MPERREAALKLRDGALDLKVLRGVKDGLELWEAAGNSHFPVSADRLARDFLRPAGVCLDPGREELGREQFLELVSRDPLLRLVSVEKHRQRWRLGSLAAEWSTVRLCGRELKTIAIEDQEAAVVQDGRAALGLSGDRNVSYPRLLDEVVFRNG